MADPTTKTTSIKLDPELHSRIRRLAQSVQRTPHWIMREAIADYVARSEQRQAFKQAAMEAWRNYQETGLHATGTEVSAWVGSWGTKGETAKPKCHK
jgi:predicted transcriptional regulator